MISNKINLDFSHLRILMCDSWEDFLLSTKTLLELHQAMVQTCQSPTETFDLIRHGAFNLIVLDVQEIDGWGLIKAIRAHPDPVVNSSPVIAYTARVITPKEKLALSTGYGFSQVLRKGDIDRLLDCLQNYANPLRMASGE